MNKFGAWVIAIPFALLGIVAGTFIPLGARTDLPSFVSMGYWVIVMGCFLGCMISYRKGYFDGKSKVEAHPPHSSPAVGSESGEA